MTVTIDDSRLRAALAKLGQELADPSVALKAIGAQMADDIRTNIKQGLRYDGSQMEPLKHPERRRQGPYKNRAGPQPLNDTRRHIHDRINSQLISRDTVAVGMLENVPIGSTHQFGSSKKGIPARPFLPIDPAGNVDLPKEWEADMLDVIKAALNTAIR